MAENDPTGVVTNAAPQRPQKEENPNIFDEKASGDNQSSADLDSRIMSTLHRGADIPDSDIIESNIAALGGTGEMDGAAGESDAGRPRSENQPDDLTGVTDLRADLYPGDQPTIPGTDGMGQLDDSGSGGDSQDLPSIEEMIELIDQTLKSETGAPTTAGHSGVVEDPAAPTVSGLLNSGDGMSSEWRDALGDNDLYGKQEDENPTVFDEQTISADQANADQENRLMSTLHQGTDDFEGTASGPVELQEGEPSQTFPTEPPPPTDPTTGNGNSGNGNGGVGTGSGQGAVNGQGNGVSGEVLAGTGNNGNGQGTVGDNGQGTDPVDPIPPADTAPPASTDPIDPIPPADTAPPASTDPIDPIPPADTAPPASTDPIDPIPPADTAPPATTDPIDPIPPADTAPPASTDPIDPTPPADTAPPTSTDPIDPIPPADTAPPASTDPIDPIPPADTAPPTSTDPIDPIPPADTAPPATTDPIDPTPPADTAPPASTNPVDPVPPADTAPPASTDPIDPVPPADTAPPASTDPIDPIPPADTAPPTSTDPIDPIPPADTAPPASTDPVDPVPPADTAPPASTDPVDPVPPADTAPPASTDPIDPFPPLDTAPTGDGGSSDPFPPLDTAPPVDSDPFPPIDPMPPIDPVPPATENPPAYDPAAGAGAPVNTPDVTTGSSGSDTMTGTGGNDAYDAGAGNDRVSGGAGDDSLFGGGGTDRLSGGTGNDTLDGGAGNDRMSGGSGSDSLSGGTGSDRLSGGTGDDSLSGGAGTDRLSGGQGSDLLDGGAGNDRMSGGAGNDSLSGGAGSDRLSGGTGNDALSGGDGADRLSGGRGEDFLDGGDGQDTVFGESGDDSLSGGAGGDFLSGGRGADTIDGGAGDDSLKGGDGGDIFVFGTDFGNDTVQDFSVGDGDRIDLSAAGISDFDSLMDNAEDTANGVVLNTDEGSITLHGVRAEDLSQDQFILADPILYDGGDESLFALDLTGMIPEGADGNGYQVMVSNMPEGAKLSSGESDGGNAWTMAIAGIVGLTIALPTTASAADQLGELLVEIVDTTTDPATVIESGRVDIDALDEASGTIVASPVEVVETQTSTGQDTVTATADTLESPAQGTIEEAAADNIGGGAGQGSFASAESLPLVEEIPIEEQPVEQTPPTEETVDDNQTGEAYGSSNGGGDSVTDSSLTGDSADVPNQSPTDLTLSTSSIGENAPNGTVIGTVVTTDADSGETFTYSLTDDAAGRFAINSITGEITVADGSLLDYESASSHNVTIQVTDSAGNTYDEVMSLNLTDVNEGPSDMTLSGDTTPENPINGTVVGTVSTTDPDAGETFSYTLTNDAGGRFMINSQTGEVMILDGSLMDISDGSSYDITVQVTDSGGLTYDEAMTINVTDIAREMEGTAGDDDFNGSRRADNINVGAGDDEIDGRGGNDIIHGGAGNDELDGGQGNDIVMGGSGDDDIEGGSGNDILDGGAGADQIDGGTGTDTATYITSSSGVNVSLDTGRGSGGDAQGDSLQNIENLTGSLNNDVLTGDSGNNVLTGSGGNDTLTGGDGSDTFIFGQGDGSDTAHGGSGGGWTDAILLQNADGSSVDGGWTVNLTSGAVQEDDGSSITLSDDAAGTITLTDGSEIAFDGMDRIDY